MADRSYSPEAIQQRQQEAANAYRQKQEAKQVKFEKPEQPQNLPVEQTETKKPFAGSSSYLDPKYTLEAVPQNKVDVTDKDWDWKNANTDASGNPIENRKFFGLNIKPVGFDPNGNPYFGSGIEGWAKKWAYKVSEERATAEKSKESWNGFWETANQFSKNVTQPLARDASAEEKQAKAQEQGSLFLKGAGELFKSIGKSSEASGAGFITTPVLRITNAAVGMTLEAFGAAADVLERGMGAQRNMREYATDAGSILPAITLDDSADEAFDKNTPLYATRADERIGLRTEAMDIAVRLFTPALQAYDAVRFWTAPGTLEEKVNIAKLGWTEGQMLYTELYKRGVREDYQKRVQAGEDPDRLAMELQDPWVEAIGEIILDPLNIIGAGGKAQKAALTLSEASEATKASGALIDIGDDLQAISKAQSNAEAAIAMSKIEDRVIETASRTGRAFDSAQSWKATALSPDGNRFKQIKETSNYLNTIVQGIRNNGGSMDDVMDYVTALAKRAGGDKELVRQSIATFSHSPFQTLAYNQAAFDTGYMLNQLIGDGEGLIKAIKNTDGTWADLTRVLDDKMRKAVDYAFPSIKEMSKAAAKNEELVKVAGYENITALRSRVDEIKDIDNVIESTRKAKLDLRDLKKKSAEGFKAELGKLKDPVLSAKVTKAEIVKNIDNQIKDLSLPLNVKGLRFGQDRPVIKALVKELREFKKSIVEEFATKLDKLNQPVLSMSQTQNEMIESVTRRIDAVDLELKALRTERAGVVDALRATRVGDTNAEQFLKNLDNNERLAAAYKKFVTENPGVAKWAKVQSVAESIVRPINGALANSYFSLSYGYAFRNFTQNMFTLFVDDGVLFTKEAAIQFTKEGIKTPRLDQAITDILGVIPESLAGKKTMVKSTTEGSFLENTFNKLNNLGYSPAKLADAAEVYSGKMIYLKKLRQVSNDALKPGAVLPDLASWTKAGFSEAQLDDFANLMKVTGYNPDKATTAFLKKYGNGSVDKWRMLDWVNPDAKKGLEEYENFWNDIVNITNRDGSQSEILDALDELKIKARQNALKATSEPVRLSDADPMWKEISNSKEQAGKFADIAEDNKLMSLKIQFDRAAAELNDALSNAAFKLKGDPNAEPLIARIQDFVSNTNRQGLNEVATKEVFERNQWAWDITKQADNANAASLWDEAILGARPYAVDKQTLLDNVWKYYRNERQSIWGGYFEKYTEQALELAKQTGHGELFGKASQSLSELQQYRNYVYNKDGIFTKVPDLKPAEIGTTQNANNVRSLANQYGISSIGEAGGANKDKAVLNIINKYAPPPEASEVDKLFSIDQAARQQELKAIKESDAYKSIQGKLDELKAQREARKTAAPSGKSIQIEQPKVETTPLTEKPKGEFTIDQEARQRELEAIKQSDAYKSVQSKLDEIKAQREARKAGTTAPKPAMQDAVKVPRSELPEDVSTRFEQEARRLLSELSGGETGKRTAEGSFGTTNVSWYRELYQKGMNRNTIDTALEKIVKDKGADKGVSVEKMKDFILDNFMYGDATNGVPPDLNVLKQLGASDEKMKTALEAYNDITKQDVTLEEAIRQSTSGEVAQLSIDKNLPYYDDAGNLIMPKVAEPITGKYTRLEDVPPQEAEKAFAKHSGHKPKFIAKDGTPKPVQEGLPVHPPRDPNTSPASHTFVETKQGVLDAIEHVKQGIKERWGLKSTVNTDMNVLSDLLKDLPEKTAIMKATAQSVAEKTRDFALLAYGETTNMDFAMSMIYPYQFWYSRSYKNWMTRAFSTNPEIIGRYANLKEALASEQKELPDWWKSQLNVSNLLGIETNNPVYMNLEATLNPLYGLTGADFNSPDKRVNWWTAALDDIGKFGPSVWAPIQWATAAYLYTQGEKEAASLWGGRMIPQTATIKSVSSFFGTPVELDPMIQQFSGDGLFDFKASDPYETKRIMRALMAMQGEGYSQEQLMEVARTQKGEIWDEAYRRAVAERRPGQLSSFFFGVGFKQRTQADVVTDEFYQDYRKLLGQRDFLPPDQFKDAWDTLREKYQQQGLSMDALLLSGKTGVERDTAFAYNVLSRIPPGEMSDMAATLGVKPYMLQQFYDGKGDLSKMTPQDKDRFMAAILDLSAMLKMPSGATRQEWNSAKETYASMNEELKKTYGADILEKIDRMYKLPQADWDAYIQANPEVEQAMRAKDAYVTNTPILGAYYGSLDTVERYYTSQVYTQLDKEFGEDIDNVLENYYFLKDNLQEEEAKRLYKANNLKAYFDRKKELLAEINDDIINAASQIPEGKGYEIRPEFQPQSGYQEEALGATVDQQAQQAQEIWAQLSPAAQQLLSESLQTGEPIPSAVSRQVKYIAEKYGMSEREAMLLLGVEQ